MEKMKHHSQFMKPFPPYQACYALMKSVCVCVCVCVCVHVCACICVCVYICTYICTKILSICNLSLFFDGGGEGGNVRAWGWRL